ncbi:MAG: hypothetical protein PWQ15_878, partial [Methanobacterium sp.]|nr:hypothetical protein [Methanobacterium sp.]
RFDPRSEVLLRFVSCTVDGILWEAHNAAGHSHLLVYAKA